MLLEFVHEGLKEPNGDIVSPIIIVAITWEVAFDFIIHADAAFIAHRLHFRVFDRA